MEEGATEGQRRLAELTHSAQADLLAIYFYTAQQWGEAQAEEYRELLRSTIEELLDRPTDAPLISKSDRVRSRVARWKNARQSHRIFYRQTESGILVLRVLHTSMNWPEHLKSIR